MKNGLTAYGHFFRDSNVSLKRGSKTVIGQEYLRKSYQVDKTRPRADELRLWSAKVTSLIRYGPYNAHGILVVEEQDKVLAIRFSPTSLPDSGKFLRKNEALPETLFLLDKIPKKIKAGVKYLKDMKTKGNEFKIILKDIDKKFDPIFFLFPLFQRDSSFRTNCRVKILYKFLIT